MLLATVEGKCYSKESGMAEKSDVTAIDDLAVAVEAIMEASPGAVSRDLIEALTAAASPVYRGLPGHLFFEAVEQAPAAISITDTNARILYANPVFEKVTGHCTEAVIGRNESILSDKSTPRHIYEEMWQTLLSGKPWSGVVVNRRKNKERYLAELTITPVSDADGTTRHYLGIHRDVTDVYRLEQQVRNQKRLIESIVNAASVPMALVGEDGAVVLDNLAYKTLAQDLESEPAELILSELGERMRKELCRWQNGGEAFGEREIRLQQPGGEFRWFVCSGSWLQEVDESATGFFKKRDRQYLLIVANEVTRLKEQQEEVRRNALRALVSEEARVQALREAISGAEYQLQGPFNLIRAALRMLERREGEEHASLVGVLHQTMDEGQQALEMLRGAIPREQREPLRQLNINQVLKDVLALGTERMLASGVTVEWHPATILPPVTGYENRLRAMFKQLIDNALDAIEERECAEREIRITTEADEEVVKIMIGDTGSGISESIRSRVFEPFFTTRARTGHVGMGLAMVREVLNLHTGSIDVQKQDHGCEIQVQIPVESTMVESTMDRKVG